jgi:hypothetical protein
VVVKSAARRDFVTATKNLRPRRKTGILAGFKAVADGQEFLPPNPQSFLARGIPATALGFWFWIL